MKNTQQEEKEAYVNIFISKFKYYFAAFLQMYYVAIRSYPDSAKIKIKISLQHNTYQIQIQLNVLIENSFKKKILNIHDALERRRRPYAW